MSQGGSKNNVVTEQCNVCKKDLYRADIDCQLTVNTEAQNVFQAECNR